MFGAGLLLGAGSSSAGTPPAAIGAVVELFTSQGCSSCPPADELLGELARREDVLALTLPVDYWDYLGWKDTLASPANTKRQRSYAGVRGDGAIYTPQMVVNGLEPAIGSDRSAVEAAIRTTATAVEPDKVEMSIAIEDDQLIITAGDATGVVKSGTLWLVLYSSQEKVGIGRGENGGRTVTYYNVVREMSPVGMWKGNALRLTLPRGDLMNRGFEGCAVILQAGPAGPIIGAAKLESW